METVVGSFAIPGATLAQIMHDFGSVESDCDGILFGRLQHQVTLSMHDDESGPPTQVKETTARVTGHYCTGRVMGFYDSVGRLNHPKLEQIIRDRRARGEDPPIGWYIGRRSTALWPSMREAAVTSCLRSVVTSSTTPKNSGDWVPLESRGNEEPGSPMSSEPKTVRTEAFGQQGGEWNVSRRRLSQPNAESPNSRSGAGSSQVSNRGWDTQGVPNTSSTSERRYELKTRGVAPPSSPPDPCFFVLFSENDSKNHAVRTHEYRAFQSLQNADGSRFEPLPVKIVNAGLSFRGFYDSFVPVARLSWFQDQLTASQIDRSALVSPHPEPGRHSYVNPTSLEINGRQERSGSRTPDDPGDQNNPEGFPGDQSVSAIHAKGFKVTEFEKIYQGMLSKLERLATDVCDSSAALQQISR